MHIILFSSNVGKIQECERIFSNVKKYTNFINEFSVIENGNTFMQNANIKLLALKDRLDSNILNTHILMAEDSGLCIEALDYKPGIYSSRYSSINNFDNEEEITNAIDCKSSENINKVIRELNKIGKSSSKAYFVSCISIYKNNKIYNAHGFLHGKVINHKEGENGFGYDPIFIPNGYKETLGTLESKIKDKISHRFKALELIKLLLK